MIHRLSSFARVTYLVQHAGSDVSTIDVTSHSNAPCDNLCFLTIFFGGQGGPHPSIRVNRQQGLYSSERIYSGFGGDGSEGCDDGT